ncbi:hypothetical protein QQO62_08390, partial [Clostridioides difficile]|nr:hypothetical protein [Clostridioides difficile]
PLQTDATLQDISSKLVEIGEGFKNGKTSIINTLSLKNIEASLNNTLVELSEKIKTSFDSSDASVQELQNQLTEKNNTISQLNTEISKRAKFAKGKCNSFNNYASLNISLNFTPNFLIIRYINVSDRSKYYVDVYSDYITTAGGTIYQSKTGGTFAIPSNDSGFTYKLTGDYSQNISNVEWIAVRV